MINLDHFRKEFDKDKLDKGSVKKDPFAQFDVWHKEVMHVDAEGAITMTLSTVDSLGQPSSRIVLLRTLGEEGFGFFTNLTSRKAIEIDGNRQASLLFFWRNFQRQVRIEGELIRMPVEVEDEYFAGRPRGSQIGAWSSPQSASIPDRKSLEKMVREYTDRFEGKDVPRPSYWGGFILDPKRVEFWQGRESRLHDRIVYSKVDNGWKIERLAP
ncbi:MAG: pyridoxamine 5'-phosphate oxidase [Bacteroidetes bacterium]|nr:MAG: pyridoxamine 5'-phosphate oxidase [Bacteroidota bacterium]